MDKITSYLLDTSALFTLLNEEDGADDVAHLMRKSIDGRVLLYLSFISVTEIFYNVWNKKDEEQAHRTAVEIKMLPLIRIDPDEKLLLLAGELKATLGLGIADSFVAATAIQHEAILVHKDPDYEALENRLRMITLPYKKVVRTKP